MIQVVPACNQDQRLVERCSLPADARDGGFDAVDRCEGIVHEFRSVPNGPGTWRWVERSELSRELVELFTNLGGMVPRATRIKRAARLRQIARQAGAAI